MAEIGGGGGQGRGRVVGNVDVEEKFSSGSSNISRSWHVVIW